MGKTHRTTTRGIVLLIRGYQYFISSLFGQCCRFYPNCSSYAIEAIQTYGCFHGSFLTMKRILRCHPWHEGGLDPVPENKQHVNDYD